MLFCLKAFQKIHDMGLELLTTTLVSKPMLLLNKLNATNFFRMVMHGCFHKQYLPSSIL